MTKCPLIFLTLLLLPFTAVQDAGAIEVKFFDVRVEGEARTVGKRRVVEFRWFKEDATLRFKARSVVKVTDGRAPKLSRSTRHSYFFWYYLNDDPGLPRQTYWERGSIGFMTTFYGRRVIETHFGKVKLNAPIDWSSSRTRTFRGTATVTMRRIVP